MSAEKFYITAAIDYVNGAPHIGHALEKVQADVLARYYRAKGRDVFFLMGTDEHGIKIMRSAKDAGKDIRVFVNENSTAFRNLKSILNLSWDDFLRTSDERRHYPGAQKLWTKLAEAGALYKRVYRGLYCVGHEAFITEKELVDGLCPDHKKKPEVIEEENWFFRLSAYLSQIESSITSGALAIIPEARKNEALGLIADLKTKSAEEQDVSFSRPSKDLPWGIPVPGDDTQTMYVWCDALASYITAIGYKEESDGFKHLWPADLHLIGKDILRFHALFWPGMLMAAQLPLPKAIFAHGFITVEGQKMSKTLGNVIDPIEFVSTYGADAVRYYLLREIPSSGDGDFARAKFIERYNGDLANGLGNFAARVLALGAPLGKIPGTFAVAEEITDRIAIARRDSNAKVEEFKLNEALGLIWELISFGDEYVNSTKPWSIEDQKEKTQVIFNLIVLLDNVAALILPFLPETSSKITASIQWDGGAIEIRKPGILFPKLK